MKAKCCELKAGARVQVCAGCSVSAADVHFTRRAECSELSNREVRRAAVSLRIMQPVCFISYFCLLLDKLKKCRLKWWVLGENDREARSTWLSAALAS